MEMDVLVNVILKMVSHVQVFLLDALLIVLQYVGIDQLKVMNVVMMEIPEITMDVQAIVRLN